MLRWEKVTRDLCRELFSELKKNQSDDRKLHEIEITFNDQRIIIPANEFNDYVKMFWQVLIPV
jgi:hypothetical protein